jgi:hypothetical protein
MHLPLYFYHGHNLRYLVIDPAFAKHVRLLGMLLDSAIFKKGRHGFPLFSISGI